MLYIDQKTTQIRLGNTATKLTRDVNKNKMLLL